MMGLKHSILNNSVEKKRMKCRKVQEYKHFKWSNNMSLKMLSTLKILESINFEFFTKLAGWCFL